MPSVLSAIVGSFPPRGGVVVGGACDAAAWGAPCNRAGGDENNRHRLAPRTNISRRMRTSGTHQRYNMRAAVLTLQCERPDDALTQTCRLLIVDDDPQVLRALSARLGRHSGFDVTCKNSGTEALACLAETRPDAVLVDLQMPGLNGLEVLKEVRSPDPDCQVILMTGNATVETALEAVKAGALDY